MHDDLVTFSSLSSSFFRSSWGWKRGFEVSNKLSGLCQFSAAGKDVNSLLLARGVGAAWVRGGGGGGWAWVESEFENWIKYAQLIFNLTVASFDQNFESL